MNLCEPSLILVQTMLPSVRLVQTVQALCEDCEACADYASLV